MLVNPQSRLVLAAWRRCNLDCSLAAGNRSERLLTKAGPLLPMSDTLT